MRRPLLVALTLLVAAAPAAAAQEPRIAPTAITPTLTALQDIADANGGNRASGLPGYDASAAWTATRLQQLGWNVTRQPVTFPFYSLRTPPVLGGLRYGRDFTVLRYSRSGAATGRLRALMASSCSNGYLRRVRRGDIVFMPNAVCSLRPLAARIARRGGVALVVLGSEQPFPITPTSVQPDTALPILLTSLGAARRLVRSENRRIPVAVDGVTEPRTADNVLAELPGTAGSRVVMAGGHLDSVPEVAGLNDNGSGVAALVAMAEALAAAPRGRDTMRLGFWAAEEWGLFGSRHYVKTLPVPERRRLDAYINLDMVGSPNPAIEVYSSRNAASTALRRRLRGAGTTPAEALSDHEAFRKVRIPVSGVFTGATEIKTRAQVRRYGGRAGVERDRCYHRRCDTLANVDQPMTARVATATLGAMVELGR